MADIDPSLYWWTVAFLLLFVELYTRDLSFLIMSAAIMIAAITVAVGLPLYVQGIVIGLVLVAGFKFFRPWALQYIPETVRRKTDWFPSFPSSMKEAKPVKRTTIAGQSGTALTVVDRNGGVIRIGKDDWQARIESSSPSAVIQKGSGIYVIRAEGVIAVVGRIEEKQ